MRPSHLGLAPLALLAALALPGLARAAPDPNWTANTTRTDCSGPTDQGTPACESYANDLYEHIDYGFSNPGTADIQVISTGSAECPPERRGPHGSSLSVPYQPLRPSGEHLIGLKLPMRRCWVS